MSEANHSNFFSPLQRRLISVSLAILALNLIGAFIFGVFLILRWFVVYFSDLLWPLAVAGILALLLKPLMHWSQRVLHIGRLTSIALLYGVVILFGLVMAALVLPVIVSQAVDFLNYLPALLDKAIFLMTRAFPDGAESVRSLFNEETLRGHLQSLTDNFQEIIAASMPALNTLKDFLSSTFSKIAGVVIIPVYIFFFLLTDKDPLRGMDEQLSFIPAWVRVDITFLFREFARIMVAFFRGQILIGLIMGVLLAVGFTLFSLRFSVFLGMIIGLLNIIPYLGSILGLLTILPLAYIQEGGGFLLLFLILGVFVIVQLIEAYLLTPKIMGHSTGLHPLVIIIAIFFWGKALSGILGMILAIPLTAFIVVVWRLLRNKYLSQAKSLPDCP